MTKIEFSLTHSNSVAKIVLNDGKGNILDSIMMNELHQILEECSQNATIKLITIEGAGKHFSFGASVEEHKKENAGMMLKNFHSLFYRISEMGIPMLAKVSGQCLGGGMEVALICNFIFADATAKFGQPEIILGVFPPPASILLPLKIGYSRAEELLITGKTISADQAQKMGLVNELFTDKLSLENATEDWIQKNILPKSASSLRYAVKAGRIFHNHILSKFLPALEEYYVSQLMNTKDANEGINAFLEKRQPEWVG
ncbi:MAG: hypothetical protein A3H98_05970 [Bacteroidetes bacterium RIFCSPLOWO2_02_FULL_36_8]|nr:MAG: hypothetical protein A3H98_05970 [Bacteroidetes bacterium RIFCSPLOWO2_02_FULL_36_8]OFY70803.1 MAG: hypothetical protein A3G23_13400 [Bacteroidetes bacterium RIFCSPLOWO2_12_FULL_37_12]